jgi:hypothetical protein
LELGVFALVREDQPANLRRGTEVEDQSGFEDGAAEVVQQLRDVGGINGSCGLQLDQDGSLDQQIGAKCPDGASPKPRMQPDFRFDGESNVPQPNGHRRAIHRFQKTVPELSVNLKKHPNNLPRELDVLERNPSAFICGYLQPTSTRPLTNLTHQTANERNLSAA